uniref:Uncharacterized protein n=1 Tax=Anguilla anguilla TaxID=7936 RepID=A0A0E9R566_ANGAN
MPVGNVMELDNTGRTVNRLQLYSLSHTHYI